MRNTLTVVLLLLAATPGWTKDISLFDGKTLTGWETSEADMQFWRVEDGVIMADSNGQNMPRNTFLFTEQEYDNFEFRCQFKLSGDPSTGLVNSGIQFRSEKLDNGHAKGYQADIGEPEWWGCIYDEHRRGLIARSDVGKLRDTLKPFGWNEYVIRAVGPKIELFINGIKTVEYTEQDLSIPVTGRFALQLHSGGICRIEYKDISLKPLKVSAPQKPKDAGLEIVFADFEDGTYDGWTIDGNAFGDRPVKLQEVPKYQGNLNAIGSYCVNSHASCPGADIPNKDAGTGSMLSDAFKITQPFIQMRIGGGAHAGQTCVNLVIDGNVVASLSGDNRNVMSTKEMAVRSHIGKTAQIQIVDHVPGDWGNIGVDHIVFAETSLASKPKPVLQGASPDEEQAGFTVPEGFVVELVASEKDGVVNPIDLTFDDAGRLWTQTASMYPLDPDPDIQWGALLRLMDDPAAQMRDGRFRQVRLMYEGKASGDDKILVFDDPYGDPAPGRVWADGLAIPQSILPYKNGAFVAHGSEMMFLNDSNGDGRADERTTVLSGLGYTDSHTMAHLLTRAPGGWIHFSQGALNKGEVVAVKSGAKTRIDFSKIARFSLDGTRVNLVSAGLNNIWGFQLRGKGQWYGTEANDGGLSITPMEEGTAFGGIGGQNLRPYQPWFPTLHSFRVGGTGISGLAFADDTSGSFPEQWRNVAFLANPITRTINAVGIYRNPDGTVRAAHLPDFLTAKDEWFRPVNLEFGPDGCLYVADFYNKIISHNEVSRRDPDRDKSHGRIWRIRHISQPERKIENFYEMASQDLPKHLDSPSLWAKRAAWHQIVDRQATELAPALVKVCLDADLEETTRILALWSLEGLTHYDATCMSTLLQSSEDELRREAVRALGNMPIGPAELGKQLALVKEDSNVMVRSQILRTLEELGKADASTIDLLVSFCQPELPGNDLGGSYERRFERYLARRALEQYPIELAAYLDSDAAKKQPESHLTWASQALSMGERETAFLNQWDTMKDTPLDESGFLAVCDLLANPQILAKVRTLFEKPDSGKLLEFALQHQARVQSPELSALLVSPCREALKSKDASQIHRGVEAVDRLRVEGLDAELAALLSKGVDADSGERCVRVLARHAAAHADTFKQVLSNRKTAHSVSIAALGALSKADAAAAAKAATGLIGELDTTEQGVFIARLSTTGPGSQILMDLLASKRLKTEAFNWPTAERIYGFCKNDKHASKLYAAKQAEYAEQQAALDVTLEKFTLIADENGGDAGAGKTIFTGICLNCHAVGSEGVGFAPPLDGSAYRDIKGLLTAILDPDAAMEGHYTLYRVSKTDDSVVEGFLEKKDDKGATLRFMGGGSLFVPTGEIQSANFVAGRSVMPRGLIDGFDDTQVADLLAYIRSLK